MKSLNFLVACTAIFAFVIWSFTPAATSQSVVQAVEPSEPVASRILYFAPAKDRNIKMDEEIVKQSAGGAKVTYITDKTEFVNQLASTWDSVLVVDIPEEALTSDDLGNHTSVDTLTVRITTGGKLSTVATDVRVFEAVTDPNDPAPYTVNTVAFNVATPTIFRIIEWVECRTWCIFNTPPLTQERRDCDRACNEAAQQ